ncbi:MAG: alpha/beta hydrolase-fold protein [bacterium]|nr:alpha/beta hydrolase-fold protein [bacterium]
MTQTVIPIRYSRDLRSAVFPAARILIAVCFGLAGRLQGQQTDHPIRQLERHPVTERRAAADSLFRPGSGVSFPIVRGDTVWFVFRSDSAKSVVLSGDFNLWHPVRDTLRPIPGTGLFVRPERFEPDARLDYKFCVDGRDWILDPLNPNTCTGGFGPNSEIAMPDYASPPEIVCNPLIPHGWLDSLGFRSPSLGNERPVFVYLPPGFPDEARGAFPLLLVTDGGEYITLGSMRNILDNLIHSGAIPRVIAVFVNPLDRNSEYWANPHYERMLSLELVPWIEARYPTVRKPGGRAILGASLGGLTALDTYLSHPDVFGLCVSQSGAFWVDQAAMVDRVRKVGSVSGRVSLDWGTYEPEIPELNRSVASLLSERGARVRTAEFHEGHSWGSWRAHVGDALRFVFGESESNPGNPGIE